MVADILDVAAVAQLLSCGEERVEELTRDRKLPALKFGRAWIYPRAALIEMLNVSALESIKRPEPVLSSPKRRAPPAL